MRRALGWEFVIVTTPAGTAGLEGAGAGWELPGWPGAVPGSAAAAGSGRGGGRAPGDAGAELGSGWNSNSQKLHTGAQNSRFALCCLSG